MVDLNSPENQKLFKGSARGQKLNSVMLLICSAATCLTTVLNVTDALSFEKNKTIIIISACVASALLAALIVLDLIYLFKYTVKIKGVLARWTADIMGSSGILDGKNRLELTCSYGRYSVILQRGDGKFTDFDLEPVKGYPNVAYSECGIIFKYVEARVYAGAAVGKPYESVILRDETGNKVKTKTFAENAVPVKNRGRKNYFIKHGLVA